MQWQCNLNIKGYVLLYVLARQVKVCTSFSVGMSTYVQLHVWACVCLDAAFRISMVLQTCRNMTQFLLHTLTNPSKAALMISTWIPTSSQLGPIGGN